MPRATGARARFRTSMAAAAAWASCVYANAWSIARVSGACSVKASAAACRHTGSEDSDGREERNRARARARSADGATHRKEAKRLVVVASRARDLGLSAEPFCAAHLTLGV